MIDERKAAIDLYGALRWLMDDLRDSGEDRNQDTEEVYDSCKHAEEVLQKHIELSAQKP